MQSEREREIERKRDRQRDRQTDRQTERQTDRARETDLCRARDLDHSHPTRAEPAASPAVEASSASLDPHPPAEVGVALEGVPSSPSSPRCSSAAKALARELRGGGGGGGRTVRVSPRVKLRPVFLDEKVEIPPPVEVVHVAVARDCEVFDHDGDGFLRGRDRSIYIYIEGERERERDKDKGQLERQKRK